MSIFKKIKNTNQSGQVVIGSVIFTVLISLAILESLVTPLSRELKLISDLEKSRVSYYVAESGIEDATYRIRNNLPYQSTYDLTLNDAVVDINIDTVNDRRIITVLGDYLERFRSLRSELMLTETEAQFFYGIQVGAGGLEMKNNARVNGNVYANHSILGANGARITGSAIVAGGESGVNTVISNMLISGVGRANAFTKGTICGDGCIVDDPPAEELPISDETINAWEQAAVAGGIHDGDYLLTNGASGSLGPKQITGKLILDNLATLTVTGTIWALGGIELSNNCQINLDPAYGATSGLMLTSAKVVIDNNCVFQGSGDPQSYIMLLSSKDAPNEEVMSIKNNSAGVVYYAGKGRLKFSNNATAKEATAYGINLDNGATITYESGLASLMFSTGPGASFRIIDWREI